MVMHDIRSKSCMMVVLGAYHHRTNRALKQILQPKASANGYAAVPSSLRLSRGCLTPTTAAVSAAQQTRRLAVKQTLRPVGASLA